MKRSLGMKRYGGTAYRCRRAVLLAAWVAAGCTGTVNALEKI